jgi:hypothetical protein
MPTIQKPALRELCKELINEHQRDPATKVDSKILDRIVAIVGDGASTTSASVADELRHGNLLPEEKVALARKGLDDSEKADIETLLTDRQMASLLDPVATNFLKALVGLEPLRPMDGISSTSRTTGVSTPVLSPAQKAVATMRQLVESGKLAKYYAAITGETPDPILKDKAMAIFRDLPKLNSATTAEQMVALGLWTTAPRGLEEKQKSARYLPGRQVLVETTVHSDVFDDRTLLSYKEDGIEARTYRASLAGEDGDDFLVKVDGKRDPIRVPKTEIYRLNQPHVFEGDRLKIANCDYNDPLTKAKLAEMAIEMDELVGQLDFTKMRTDAATGHASVWGRGSRARDMHEIQRACVRVVHDSIDMRYTGHNDRQPGRSSGGGAGRQAIKGRGVCFEQSSVMCALLAPFSQMLGVDIQFISGGVYRHVRRGDTNPFRGGAHGWLQLTYRPSMEYRICDRTWRQPDKTMDRAYSRWGDRYPGGFYWGMKTAEVTDTDVNFSGDISVATFDRQFGAQGVDGRDNHMTTVTG